MDPAIEIGIRVPACVPVPQLADFVVRAEAAGFAFVAVPDVQTIAEIPHTATGKINKLKLREIFANYKLPTDA